MAPGPGAAVSSNLSSTGSADDTTGSTAESCFVLENLHLLIVFFVVYSKSGLRAI